MSTKDLLEKMSRKPNTRGPARPKVAAAPVVETKAGGDTRVSRRVVRRRRKPSSPEATKAVVAQAAPTTVSSKQAASASTTVTPVTASVESTSQVPLKSLNARKNSNKAQVLVKGPPPKAKAKAKVKPAAPVVVEAVVKPAESPKVESPAPKVESPAPKVESPAVAAKPVEAPAVETKPEPKPVTLRRPARERATLVSRPTDAEIASRAGRFSGLGSAVVVPPPGYDPSRPSAYRPAPPPGTTNPAGPRRRKVAARVTGAGAPGGGGGGRRNSGGRRQGRGSAFSRRPRRRSGPKKASPAPKGMKRRIRIDHQVSVGQLAQELSIKAAQIIRQLMAMDMMVRINDMLDFDTASLIASEYDYELENVGFQESAFLDHIDVDDEDPDSTPRSPIVTIMGHVDHGKTTLLDAIRKTKVVAGEAGGITQHIGAYEVEREDGTITFLDTPGHAAFSAMRARGADVTDIVVLVVAADDGVQPQTEEAIAHAKAAGAPIIVAVNKIDKAGVNPDSVKQRLGDFGLLPEEWGGETLFVHVSALRGDGIDELLESILLQADMLDLRANADRIAEGVVIEAKMERGRGAVVSVLVKTGTLKTGNTIVVGETFGKVRAMFDHQGKKIKVAGPSKPVEIFGLSALPSVGSAVSVVKNEKAARKIAEYRVDTTKADRAAAHRRKTSEDLFAAARGESTEKLHVVLKADVQGSLEAIRGALEAFEIEGSELRILHAGVGPISESDVSLVAANGGLLLGFNVKVDAKASRSADEAGVSPELFKVVYGLLDHVEASMKGLLAPEFEAVRQGSAEIRVVYHISKVGSIAGCYVQDGKVGRNHLAKLHRDGELIWEGEMGTLKRFKDDVREVGNGYECGIALAGFNDIKEGDIIETFALVEIDKS